MASPSSTPLPDGILTLALPAPNAPVPAPHPSSASSRRIPPPCWTHDETLALIDSYKSKWVSLNRGVLRAPHWLDVASSLSLLSPSPNKPKTPVQCRHKIEKLRKRYRAELLRAARPHPSAPPRSTWLYFPKMHALGLSPSTAAPPLNPYSSSSSDDDDGPPELPAPNSVLRFRIPVRGEERAPLAIYSRRNGDYMEDDEEAGGIVRGLMGAVRRLADGYMRMECMNMDMMREIEKMRMETELKQTEMMLETQRRIVDTFARRMGGGRKRSKVTPES